MSLKRNQRLFQIGSGLLTLAGCFPICVGITLYFRSMSKLRLDHWLSIFSGNSYSNGDLPLVDESIYVLSHMGYTNLIATGITLVTVSIFALRRKRLWGWWLLAFLVLWVGLNDSVLSVWQYLRNQKSNVYFPFPLFPSTLGVFGLILTRISTNWRQDG